MYSSGFWWRYQYPSRLRNHYDSQTGAQHIKFEPWAHRNDGHPPPPSPAVWNRFLECATGVLDSLTDKQVYQLRHNENSEWPNSLAEPLRIAEKEMYFNACSTFVPECHLGEVEIPEPRLTRSIDRTNFKSDARFVLNQHLDLMEEDIHSGSVILKQFEKAQSASMMEYFERLEALRKFHEQLKEEDPPMASQCKKIARSGLLELTRSMSRHKWDTPESDTAHNNAGDVDMSNDQASAPGVSSGVVARMSVSEWKESLANSQNGVCKDRKSLLRSEWAHRYTRMIGSTIMRTDISWLQGTYLAKNCTLEKLVKQSFDLAKELARRTPKRHLEWADNKRDVLADHLSQMSAEASREASKHGWAYTLHDTAVCVICPKLETVVTPNQAYIPIDSASNHDLDVPSPYTVEELRSSLFRLILDVSFKTHHTQPWIKFKVRSAEEFSGLIRL